MRLIILSLFVSLLAACAARPVVDNSNIIKASEANAKLGLGYMQQGRYETALGKLKKSLRQNPENADAHQYIAVLYDKLGHYEDADRHYQKALEYMPDSNLSSRVAAVRNNYAVFLCKQKRYEDADRYFEMVKSDPLYQSRDRLLENMGLCAQEKGDIHQAEMLFNKALRLNPKSRKSLLGLAQISHDKGLNNQAQAYMNKYLKYSAHNAESLWLAILIERRRGNLDRVANYSIRLKSKYPNSKEAQLLKQLEMQDSK